MGSIEGAWHATMDPSAPCACGCGYTGTWRISAVDEETIIVKEDCGSHCCGCVPNPCPKCERMRQVGDGEWAGTLGCKPVQLKRRSDTELYHLTPDGPMIMTRL